MQTGNLMKKETKLKRCFALPLSCCWLMAVIHPQRLLPGMDQ